MLNNLLPMAENFPEVNEANEMLDPGNIFEGSNRSTALAIPVIPEPMAVCNWARFDPVIDPSAPVTDPIRDSGNPVKVLVIIALDKDPMLSVFNNPVKEVVFIPAALKLCPMMSRPPVFSMTLFTNCKGFPRLLSSAKFTKLPKPAKSVANDGKALDISENPPVIIEFMLVNILRESEPAAVMN